MRARGISRNTVAAATQQALSGELLPRPVRRHKGNMENIAGQMGKGRPKGIPNKFTREVKEVIAQCFTDIGGAKAFAQWAKENRHDFYKLYAKLLPIQLQGTGVNGEIQIVVSADDRRL